MITQICHTHTSQHTIFQGDDQDETVTSSRYCINWDKVIVFANAALIVAGIAAGFFMKIPLLMLGLGVYGSLYLLLKSLADRQQVEIRDEQREDFKERIKGLEEEIVKLDKRKDRILGETAAARRIRGENLSEEELDRLAERSVNIARGQAAEAWVLREMQIAERKNPELYMKFKELGKVMNDAGEALKR